MAEARPRGVQGRTVVLGVGESYRRDDGCGPRVVRALRDRLPPGVERIERVAETTALIDLWDGAGLAVVVDAMRSGASVGSIVRWEGEELRRASAERVTSSHGLSVRDAYELGRALGRLPQRLVTYLIEAGELGPGETLSPEVAGAVGRVAEAIVAELNGARASRPRGG